MHRTVQDESKRDVASGLEVGTELHRSFIRFKLSRRERNAFLVLWYTIHTANYSRIATISYVRHPENREEQHGRQALK
jgi:hypothetical protein